MALATNATQSPAVKELTRRAGGNVDAQTTEAQVQMRKKNTRIPLWLNLPVGLAHMAWAMFDGFKKYGIASWRKKEVPVTALDMIGAAERHLQLLKDGQDFASDSKAHHAGHVMASMAIYLDCEAIGKEGFDNRITGPAADVWAKLADMGGNA